MPRYIALVPAAGTGSRFGAHLPKQYLPLAGQPLIRHALATLCAHPRIDRVVVVLSPDDLYWRGYDWSALGPKLMPVHCGGASRAVSVRNGLFEIAGWARPEDWVLVHDAARPCLGTDLLDTLITALADDTIGGLLAVPVADTLKRADTEGRIERTVSREDMWQAQTPQMFRLGLLQDALDRSTDVTDEASAIEAAGHAPKLVASRAGNLKVTWPEDMKLAELILRTREETA
ncbi:MAG: 2-C-methyl-D-erythritol 4-phosphate cytidylyltransferase [Methyloversatilis sp.]|jgi:2-C-methyl-D-erythritol 4-phosphate cytidylyltransferase|nr:2-C-methyl-D-erythritol 4-phosphate cytidylyltransferase [Methyloversatilis sp.]MBP6195718.1 2-C-methyl-D-erythritol 4-phosphate cytidylyltransferase [Methyloversatilis sp.]MBP9118088.1 2-C-methyl-D-erythritol 4-phosphate cytidylyltransferase [Methyloversatilis sp.]